MITSAILGLKFENLNGLDSLPRNGAYCNWYKQLKTWIEQHRKIIREVSCPLFYRLVLANLPRRVTQAKFHIDSSSPNVPIQDLALEGKGGMQACLAVMGLKGPMWEEPHLPWELVLSSQVRALLHPEADDRCLLNPQPVVENNKVLGEMSLNLTPTATSKIWWSKEGTLPYFAQGKIMGSFPWKGSVQTTGLICFLNLTFVKFHKCPHPILHGTHE